MLAGRSAWIAYRQRSDLIQVFECFGGLSLDPGVPMRCGGGVGCGEQVSGPFDVARSVPFEEHPGPGEVGVCCEELGASPIVELGGRAK